MKEDTKIWIQYSTANLEAAKVLLDSNLFNPALQNVQQSIEKSLKAIFIEKGIKLRKSHGILELRNILSVKKIDVDLSEDECDLLDSIYLTSKYPVGSALPDFYPDKDITKKCIAIAERVLNETKNMMK